jgi:hypothetical protein
MSRTPRLRATESTTGVSAIVEIALGRVMLPKTCIQGTQPSVRRLLSRPLGRRSRTAYCTFLHRHPTSPTTNDLSFLLPRFVPRSLPRDLRVETRGWARTLSIRTIPARMLQTSSRDCRKPQLLLWVGPPSSVVGHPYTRVPECRARATGVCFERHPRLLWRMNG